MLPIISHAVGIHEQTWARVYLNDVPLFRSPHFGPDSQSGPINHLLRKGENEVSVELLRVTPDNANGPIQDAFRFQLYTVNNLGAPEGVPLDKTLICEVRYPQMVETVAPAHRHFPFFYRQTFQVDVALPTPRFFDAPAAVFDCHGLTEQRAAVQYLYGLLERGEHEALLDELSLKFEAMERAFPDEDRMRAASRKREWREELFAYDPRPDGPLDFAALHFESRRGGQVLHVTRYDERHALEATCAGDPNRQILTDLVMLQHEGRWRVFT